MKKYVRLLPAVILLLAAALFWLIYTRPAGIEQRYPMLDLSQCTQINGYYYGYDKAGAEDTPFTLTPEDPHFAALTELLQTREFRTKLRNLFPDTAKVHRYSEGDFQWTLTLHFEDVPFPNGNVGSGALLRIDNFFGDLELHSDGENTHCFTADQDAWLKSVMDIISQYPD